jgi:aryl-alcohol dehydrogenase-like predicted oxidoreductase
LRQSSLGPSGLRVPPLCIGSYTLTAAWAGDAHAGEHALRAAIDEGVLFFDTARAYGRAEAIIGRVLADVIATRRADLVLCSKGGFDLVRRPGALTPFKPNSRPEYLRECLLNSLRRLGTDYLDIYLIHWYDPTVPVAEAAGAMAEFVQEGLVRQVGVSNYPVAQMRQFHAGVPLAVAQIPYSLFARSADTDLIPYLESVGARIMGYAALAQGFLTGAFRRGQSFPPEDFRSHTPDFHSERFDRRVLAAAQLTEIARDLGCSLAELALAWVLSSPSGVIPVVGAQVPEHVRSSVRALKLALPVGCRERLTAIAAQAPEMDFASLVQ